MSAPVSHDPLVVNTQDGCCWTRRAVNRAGRGLYALADVKGDVPELVLATLPELAEHGLGSMAFALPVPVGPEPRDVEDELTGARLSLFEEEQETARLRLALKSAKRGRLQARETVRQMVEALNCYDCPPPDESPLECADRWRRYADAAEARVAELEAERHVTNEALDDVVQELRARRENKAAPYTATPEAHAEMRAALRGYFAGSSQERPGEFESTLRHAYTTPHDLDLPSTGGQQ